MWGGGGGGGEREGCLGSPLRLDKIKIWSDMILILVWTSSEIKKLWFPLFND